MTKKQKSISKKGEALIQQIEKLIEDADRMDIWLFAGIRRPDGEIECFSSPNTPDQVTNDAATGWDMACESINEVEDAKEAFEIEEESEA